MFSIAGDLVSVQSANLGCDHVNKLIFLKRVAVFELEDTERIEKVLMKTTSSFKLPLTHYILPFHNYYSPTQYLQNVNPFLDRFLSNLT